ncbi:RNA-binding protein 42 [Geodia barretti]|uniref:RNA-binding protein 42 n=1 Tax=Geodia barretti TaxID=519541 RepID=A0AA35SCW3_GEOBA|nr:RNA-binding protein 42 [Geodia barretti]
MYVVEGYSEGAEGGVVEAGLLPVPKKPPKGIKTDVTKLRLGGGQVWQDHSLEDWDPNDFRIFVGDLGNDVNDDLLARTFSKYPSFLKARVIRDKWTKKTKGYGFVSFKDPHDFIQAMREMNGRYIGNRPMRLRKSTWKDRNFLEVKKKEKSKKRLGFKV